MIFRAIIARIEGSLTTNKGVFAFGDPCDLRNPPTPSLQLGRARMIVDVYFANLGVCSGEELFSVCRHERLEFALGRKSQ